jgi:hypothetical protein
VVRHDYPLVQHLDLLLPHTVLPRHGSNHWGGSRPKRHRPLGALLSRNRNTGAPALRHLEPQAVYGRKSQPSMEQPLPARASAGVGARGYASLAASHAPPVSTSLGVRCRASPRLELGLKLRYGALFYQGRRGQLGEDTSLRGARLNSQRQTNYWALSPVAAPRSWRGCMRQITAVKATKLKHA